MSLWIIFYYYFVEILLSIQKYRPEIERQANVSCEGGALLLNNDLKTLLCFSASATLVLQKQYVPSY